MMRRSLLGATGSQSNKEDDVPPVSHQTIKLSRGKHSSPEHGACVMELASMLAGEGFSDHPRSVSRPIASFLRGYNDLVDDRRRQNLYAYAAQAVGTADSRTIEDARAARLLAFGDELWERRSRGSLLDRVRRRRVRKERSLEAEPAGTYAVHAIGKVNTQSHTAALDLVDELIAMGSRPGDTVPAADAGLLLSS
jgi:hypothetical protein